MMHAALFAAVYGVLAFAALGIRERISLSSIVWPAAGILLGKLVQSPKRHWGLWGGIAMLLHTLAGLHGGRTLPIAALFAGIDFLVTVCIALAWQAPVKHARSLQKPLDLCYFFLLVCLGAYVGGHLSIWALDAVWAHTPSRGWFAWGIAFAVGCFIAAPWAMTWEDSRIRRSGGMTFKQLGIGLTWLLCLLLSMQLVFDDQLGSYLFGSPASELSYLPLLFVVLIAVTWGQLGTTISILLLAIYGGYKTVHGNGPFGSLEVFFGNALLELQCYIAAAALLGLLMNAFTAERNRALVAANNWKLRFEAALLSSRQLMFECDPESSHILWGGDVKHVLGISAKELSTVQAFLAHLPAQDQEPISRLMLAKQVHPKNHGYRFQFLRPNGDITNFIIEGAPILDFDNTVYRIDGFLRQAS